MDIVKDTDDTFIQYFSLNLLSTLANERLNTTVIDLSIATRSKHLNFVPKMLEYYKLWSIPFR